MLKKKKIGILMLVNILTISSFCLNANAINKKHCNRNNKK